MRSRQVNQLLWWVASLGVATGLLAVVLSILSPLDLPAAADANVKPHPVAGDSDPSPASTAVVSFAGRTFRTGAPVAAAANAPPAAPANDLSAVQLVGTIGDTIAMLRGPDGTTAIVEVGDDVNGAAVLAIRPLQIDLKLNGRKTTLVKSDASDSNASDPNAAAWPSQP